MRTTAGSGESATLVLIGEPGIGKIALLDHGAARASGMQCCASAASSPRRKSHPCSSAFARRLGCSTASQSDKRPCDHIRRERSPRPQRDDRLIAAAVAVCGSGWRDRDGPSTHVRTNRAGRSLDQDRRIAPCPGHDVTARRTRRIRRAGPDGVRAKRRSGEVGRWRGAVWSFSSAPLPNPA